MPDHRCTREILFDASAELAGRTLAALEAAPATASTLDLVAAALDAGLRRRGIGDTEASLAAEAGSAVYRAAFQRWVDAADDLDLRDAIHQLFTHLRA